MDRLLSESELVARSLFKKEADLSSFLGLWVQLDTGERGILAGPFGQGGKVRIQLKGKPLTWEAVQGQDQTKKEINAGQHH